jgi:hypothetical protein
MLDPNGSRPPHIRLNSAQSDLQSLSNSPIDPPRPDTANPPKPDTTNRRSLIPSRPTGPPTNNPVISQRLRSNAPPGPGESSERLLPPKRQSRHRFRDDDSGRNTPDTPGFRSPTGMSSRRTSFSSEAGSRRSSRGYPSDPFADSRAPSRAGSDDDNVNTQTVSEKYNILPSAGLLLFPEDVEKDDWLHNPDPNEKEVRECDIWTKRGMMNVGGLAFITLGILVLFIGYPVMWVSSLWLTPRYATIRLWFRNGYKNILANVVSPTELLWKSIRIHQILAPQIPTVSTWAKFHYSKTYGVA